MNNKGFTLIELLAVIVILAVIALIAVPIILNVIDKAKQGAAESSALGYVDAVEKQVMINNLKKDDTLLITEGEYTKVGLAAKGLTIKGEVKDALVRINTKGKVENGKFCIDDYSVDYNGKKAVVNKSADYCSNIHVYNASDIGYSNAASEQNCTDVNCALNELYSEINE